MWAGVECRGPSSGQDAAEHQPRQSVSVQQAPSVLTIGLRSEARQRPVSDARPRKLALAVDHLAGKSADHGCFRADRLWVRRSVEQSINCLVRFLSFVLGAKPACPGTRSSNNLIDWMTIVDFESFVLRQRQPAWVQSQLLHNGCMNIGDIMRILDGMKPDWVCTSVDDPPF